MKNDSYWEIPSAEPFDELDANILAALEKMGAVIPITSSYRTLKAFKDHLWLF